MLKHIGTRVGYSCADEETIRRIINRRKELDMSQTQLAHLLGYTSRSTIARIESMSLPLSVTKLSKWAVVLQTTQEYLLHLTDDIGGTSSDADDPVSEKIMYYLSTMSRKEKNMILDFAEQIIKYRD